MIEILGLPRLVYETTVRRLAAAKDVLLQRLLVKLPQLRMQGALICRTVMLQSHATPPMMIEHAYFHPLVTCRVVGRCHLAKMSSNHPPVYWYDPTERTQLTVQMCEEVSCHKPEIHPPFSSVSLRATSARFEPNYCATVEPNSMGPGLWKPQFNAQHKFSTRMWAGFCWFSF